jgi:hypothetical protein
MGDEWHGTPKIKNDELRIKNEKLCSDFPSCCGESSTRKLLALIPIQLFNYLTIQRLNP